MTESNTSILKGRVVSLEEIMACNESVGRCRTNYKVDYKYDPSSLPDCFEVGRFCEHESNEKEVAVLQNAVKCLKVMKWCPDDTTILEEYANDTLLTFDFNTGKNIFDDKTFEKDSAEHKNKQLLLIDEYNKIVASSTLLNAVENAEKLHRIKAKIAELQMTQPKKDDAKYNHREIVKGTTSVKQVLDRYKELRELRNKNDQEWDQYITDYKRSNAQKLSISEDTFRIFKELDKAGVFTSGVINPFSKTYEAIVRYECVKDCNENSWKNVSFDGSTEGRKFLKQKQLKLWQKYGRYNKQFDGPCVLDWMMYDYFNDTDLTWLTALKAFNERVMALKRIEEQQTDVCKQQTDVCKQQTDVCKQQTDACEKNSSK